MLINELATWSKITRVLLVKFRVGDVINVDIISVVLLFNYSHHLFFHLFLHLFFQLFFHLFFNLIFFFFGLSRLGDVSINRLSLLERIQLRLQLAYCHAQAKLLGFFNQLDLVRDCRDVKDYFRGFISLVFLVAEVLKNLYAVRINTGEL